MAPYIYFGPKAPAGKQASWMYTASGKTFFPGHALLRSRQTAVRQDVEAAGHRSNELSDGEPP